MASTTMATARARVAALSRSRSADDVEYLDARRDLASTQLEQYVAKVVASAPPLTDEQRDRIVVLLRPPTTGREDLDTTPVVGA